MSIELKVGGRYKTRDGRKARCVCDDVRHDLYPCVVLVTNFDGKEGAALYTREGSYLFDGNEHPYDIIAEVGPLDDCKPGDLIEHVTGDHVRYFSGIRGTNVVTTSFPPESLGGGSFLELPASGWKPVTPERAAELRAAGMERMKAYMESVK